MLRKRKDTLEVIIRRHNCNDLDDINPLVRNMLNKAMSQVFSGFCSQAQFDVKPVVSVLKTWQGKFPLNKKSYSCAMYI